MRKSKSEKAGGADLLVHKPCSLSGRQLPPRPSVFVLSGCVSQHFCGDLSKMLLSLSFSPTQDTWPLTLSARHSSRALKAPEGATHPWCRSFTPLHPLPGTLVSNHITQLRTGAELSLCFLPKPAQTTSNCLTLKSPDPSMQSVHVLDKQDH